MFIINRLIILNFKLKQNDANKMELASPLKKRNFQLQEEQNNFMLIDFNKINYEQLDANLNLNNKENNNIYERYLEEISKLKTKITNLESKLNQCKFRKTNQDDNLKSKAKKRMKKFK